MEHNYAKKTDFIISVVLVREVKSILTTLQYAQVSPSERWADRGVNFAGGP